MTLTLRTKNTTTEVESINDPAYKRLLNLQVPGGIRISCDQCQMLCINGHPCHETGCPNSWKDRKRECKWCGGKFAPTELRQCFCEESCERSYHGYDNDEEDT